MRKMMVMVMLLLISGVAHADTMYRCVDKSGGVAYQDHPCGSEATQTRTVEFTPERVPVYRPPKQSASTRVSHRGAASGAHVPIEPSSTACESAKARREKALRKAGLKRTYRLLQQLDEDVRSACR
ncbi:DUF4124 domain-containing protein [Lysobacter terrae]